MPKRIGKGPLPSPTVPQGALLGVGAGAAPLTEALSTLAGVGHKIAAGKEHEEALKLRQAREAKQVITNVVNVNLIAGNYREDLATQVKKIEADNWETPELIPEQVRTWGLQAADRYTNAASNTDISLGVAQKTGAHLDLVMRGVHDQARRRQTQKAKGDLDLIINRASAEARDAVSYPALDVLIRTKDAELAPMFQGVLGPEALAARKKMRVEMTRAWAFATSNRDFSATLAALAAKKGPIVDYLDVSGREAVKKDAIASFEGLQKTRTRDAIQDGISSNQKLAEAFMAGTPDLGGIIYDQTRALEGQKEAVAARLELDTAVLEEFGIDPIGLGDKEVLSLIDDRLAFVKAIKETHQKQIPFDTPGDPASEAALLVLQNKALKSATGKDTASVVKFQRALAIAVSDRKVSGAFASTAIKTMSLSLEKAVANAEDPAGVNLYLAWRYPRVAGDMELNDQFKTQFRNVDKATQTRVRMEYQRLFNEAMALGPVDGKTARRLALRALALETETHIPGVD